MLVGCPLGSLALHRLCLLPVSSPGPGAVSSGAWLLAVSPACFLHTFLWPQLPLSLMNSRHAPVRAQGSLPKSGPYFSSVNCRVMVSNKALFTQTSPASTCLTHASCLLWGEKEMPRTTEHRPPRITPRLTTKNPPDGLVDG